MPQERCMACMRLVNPGSTVCSGCGAPIPCAPNHPHSLQPGYMLNGRWLIGKELGRGGYGISYIAFDTHLSIKRCIKEYFPATCERNEDMTPRIRPKRQEEFVRNAKHFLYEARVLSVLCARVKEVVGVHDQVNANGTSYIVMDYLDGSTLDAHLVARRSPLPWEDALSIMLSVLKILSEIHGCGFLHRDLSLSNIFIDKQGRIKLIDFGSAATISDAVNHPEVIWPSFKKHYSPEEQVRRSQQGPWTDVYAVGACLFKLIAGRWPEDSAQSFGFPSFASMGVKVPEKLEEALQKATCPNRSGRYQTADEMGQALGEIMAAMRQSRQTLPETQSTPAPQTKPTRKRSKAPLIVAATMLILAGGVLLGTGVNNAAPNSTHLPTLPAVVEETPVVTDGPTETPTATATAVPTAKIIVGTVMTTKGAGVPLSPATSTPRNAGSQIVLNSFNEFVEHVTVLVVDDMVKGWYGNRGSFTAFPQGTELYARLDSKRMFTPGVKNIRIYINCSRTRDETVYIIPAFDLGSNGGIMRDHFDRVQLLLRAWDDVGDVAAGEKLVMSADDWWNLHSLVTDKVKAGCSCSFQLVQHGDKLRVKVNVEGGDSKTSTSYEVKRYDPALVVTPSPKPVYRPAADPTATPKNATPRPTMEHITARPPKTPGPDETPPWWDSLFGNRTAEPTVTPTREPTDAPLFATPAPTQIVSPRPLAPGTETPGTEESAPEVSAPEAPETCEPVEGTESEGTSAGDWYEWDWTGPCAPENCEPTTEPPIPNTPWPDSIPENAISVNDIIAEWEKILEEWGATRID